MQVFSNKSKELMENIETYLEYVTISSLHFLEAMKEYIGGKREKFNQRIKEVIAIERKADEDLKDVKYKLYAFMLIPDTRADVYKLMDDLDDIVDYAKSVLLELHIEQPQFPESLKAELLQICEHSVKAVESLMLGVRALFCQAKFVEEHVHKVEFYEREVDSIQEHTLRNIYTLPDIGELAFKNQLKYFVNRFALLSDLSEDIGKNLLIYTIKRMV